GWKLSPSRLGKGCRGALRWCGLARHGTFSLASRSSSERPPVYARALAHAVEGHLTCLDIEIFQGRVLSMVDACRHPSSASTASSPPVESGHGCGRSRAPMRPSSCTTSPGRGAPCYAERGSDSHPSRVPTG